jgi:hypothetical protein
LTIIRLAKKFYDFNILVFLLKNIVSDYNNLKAEALKCIMNRVFIPAPHKCRKYNSHGVPLHTKLTRCTRDGRGNIRQFIK